MERITARSLPLIDSLSEDFNSGQDQAARNTSGSEPPIDNLTYCVRRMRTMLACYRKDETSNPDEYVAAGAAVLSEYDLVIVDYVTDPRTGMPSKVQWLPTVKEIRDSCESEALRIQRFMEMEKLPKLSPRRSTLPAQVRATIFTAQSYPRYDELKKRAEAEKCHPCYFENHVCIDNVERYGIWTPYSWVAP